MSPPPLKPGGGQELPWGHTKNLLGYFFCWETDQGLASACRTNRMRKKLGDFGDRVRRIWLHQDWGAGLMASCGPQERELVCEGPVSVEAPAAALGGERRGTEEGVLRDRSKQRFFCPSTWNCRERAPQGTSRVLKIPMRERVSIKLPPGLGNTEPDYFGSSPKKTLPAPLPVSICISQSQGGRSYCYLVFLYCIEMSNF